jgi:hypothetical protein
MAVDLAVPETITNMTISFYMLAMAIFPLWWYGLPLPRSLPTH